jgi:hypothetical protein
VADSLSAAEVLAFAEMFPDPQSAGRLLAMAGLGYGSQPGWAAGLSAEDWWWEVSRLLAAGKVMHGRRLLMEAARGQFPANPIFVAHSDGTAPGPSDGLSDVEIFELASAFSDPISARALLDEIGFPRPIQPAWATTAELFWRHVSGELAAGVLRDGRERLLAAAGSRYPANGVFESRRESSPAGPRTLTANEIEALADAYPSPVAATQLLVRAGFRASVLPTWRPTDPVEFWGQVSALLGVGVLSQGRERLLGEAVRDYPANPVFGLRSADDSRDRHLHLGVPVAPPGTEQPSAAPAPDGWDFFISYTESDTKWAEWIAWQLESDGFTVLVQAWDFVPGSNWTVSMQNGIANATRTIAVVSNSYLRSVYGQAEWQAAWRDDPTGLRRKLIPIRVEECARPGALGQVVSIDLFGLIASEAAHRLRETIRAALIGRAKPAVEPDFPDIGSLALATVDARPPAKPPVTGEPTFPPAEPEVRLPIRELGEVFQPTGIPEITFVQQEHFIPFRMTLRQPGLSLVLEGPSGLGKTTLLKHAIAQDEGRFGTPIILSARIARNVAEIDRMTVDGHDGIVAIDDFHRLSEELKVRVADYLKQLADSGSSTSKIAIVGIPDTARSLVTFSHDIANRIRVFKPNPASPTEIRALVELGEKALNIEFDDRAAIVEASSGSLITTQALCWHLATMAGIEETVRTPRRIRTNIAAAKARVAEELRIKYSDLVVEFSDLDESGQTICKDLLVGLAWSMGGILSLDGYKKTHPHAERAVDQIFIPRVAGKLAESPAISRNIFYDPRARRLVSDDPQLIFYLRQLSL